MNEGHSLGDWTIGKQVELVGPRVLARSLRETDIDDQILDWMGASHRTSHVWKPPIPAGDYMRGLVQSCDQRRTFVFGIFPKGTARPIGYRKVQLIEEGEGLTLIPTTVIGVEHRVGEGYARDAACLIDWFLALKLGTVRSCPRVYEDNVDVLALLRRTGYRELRRATEVSPSGHSRKYVVFERSMREHLLTLGDETKLYRADVLA